MSILGSDVERCEPILVLKIHVVSILNQLLRDGHMSFLGRDEQRCEPITCLINFIVSFNELFDD
jgi:hypothetical protein